MEKGSDFLNSDHIPWQSHAGTGVANWLDFRLFTVIIIYLFILCLLVVPGLILDISVMAGAGEADRVMTRAFLCDLVISTVWEIQNVEVYGVTWASHLSF